MTPTITARRAAAVSAGALALSLFAGGTAFADTGLPLPSVTSVPGVPSPDNVITTLDQTVTQVTSTQPSTTPPSSTPSTPSAPSSGGTSTTTKTPTTKPAPEPAAKSAPRTTTNNRPAASTYATSPVGYDAVTPGDIALPPATGVSAAAGSAPAIAPLLMPQAPTRITPAAALAELDKHSGSPLRAILLTLAIAAAVGVGYGHLRVVRV